MQEVERPETFEGGEEKVVENSSAVKSWFQSEAAVRYLYGAVGFIVIALIMHWLQFSTKAICCGDFDGYYHIRWSQLLWENFSHGKWLPEFTWLPLTVLSPDSYADHHFLFHLLQIPFLWFFEPIMAAKVSAFVYSTLAIFSCYWLILRYKIEYPLVWLLGLMTCANPFFYRMNMAKAPPIAIIFTILGIWLLFERRYKWLFPLTFAFVWAYSLYPMLIVAALIWGIIIFWNDSKVEWQPLAYTVGGAVLGNVINPYFPRNIWLFIEHFSEKFRIGDFEVPVGGEWYPYDSKALLGMCAIALLSMFIGYILYRPEEKRLDEKSTFFLLFATGLMIWMFQSKRYAEYFPPMAILFAAFAFQAFANRLKSDILVLPEDFRRELLPYLDRPTTSESGDKNGFWRTAFVGLICVMLLIYMFFNLHGISIPSKKIEIKGLAMELAENEPPERFQKGMEWAVANIPEFDPNLNGGRTRIFNTDWDDFPKIFFHDTKHAYIAGLDPNYLFSRNQELWKLYEQITTGKTEDAAPIIRDKFGARYIFSDLHHDDFYAKIVESGWVDKIYEDDDSMLLKIRDQKGEPPSESNDAGATDNSDDNTNSADNSNDEMEDNAEQPETNAK
ncbi:MAG: hypothetical protein ABI954_15480 [Pyrinomonadaceae bacterium]